DHELQHAAGEVRGRRLNQEVGDVEVEQADDHDQDDARRLDRPWRRPWSGHDQVNARRRQLVTWLGLLPEGSCSVPQMGSSRLRVHLSGVEPLVEADRRSWACSSPAWIPPPTLRRSCYTNCSVTRRWRGPARRRLTASWPPVRSTRRRCRTPRPSGTPVMESLRLHPIAPGITRTVATPFEFGGFELEEGAIIQRHLPEAD